MGPINHDYKNWSLFNLKENATWLHQILVSETERWWDLPSPIHTALQAEIQKQQRYFQSISIISVNIKLSFLVVFKTTTCSQETFSCLFVSWCTRRGDSERHWCTRRWDSERRLNELQRWARAAAISADPRDGHETLRLLLQPPRSLCASIGHSPHLPS